jgi:hypothetical protein
VLAIAVQMEIFIMNLTGKSITLMVNSSDTIFNIKEMFFDKEKTFSVHQPCLLFDCKELDDRWTLADYNIQEKSTIDLIPRIIGD